MKKLYILILLSLICIIFSCCSTSNKEKIDDKEKSNLELLENPPYSQNDKPTDTDINTPNPEQVNNAKQQVTEEQKTKIIRDIEKQFDMDDVELIDAVKNKDNILACTYCINRPNKRYQLWMCKNDEIKEIGQCGDVFNIALGDNGFYIKYATYSGGNHSYIDFYDLSTNERKLIYDSDVDLSLNGVSPDGKYLAIGERYKISIFTEDKLIYENQFYYMDCDDDKDLLNYNGGNFYADIIWSNDNKNLLIGQSNHDNICAFHLLDIDTLEYQSYYYDNQYLCNNSYPRIYSPKCDYVIYTSYLYEKENDDAVNNYNLFVTEIKTGNIYKLTTLDEYCGYDFNFSSEDVITLHNL